MTLRSPKPPCVCVSLCVCASPMASLWGECGLLPLQELLAEWRLRRGPRSVCGRLKQVAVLGLVWLLCLGITLGCTVAVYTFSEFMIEVRGLGGRTPA